MVATVAAAWWATTTPAAACENSYVRLTSGYALALTAEFATLSKTDPEACDAVAVWLSPNYSAFLPDDVARALIEGGVFPLRIIGNDLPGGHEAHKEARFEEVAARYGNCRETAEGLTLCTSCAPGDCDVETAAFYVRGREWTASCGELTAGAARYCRSVYMIAPGLGVSYRFGRVGVDTGGLAKLDAAVRQAVEALRLPKLDRPPA